MNNSLYPNLMVQLRGFSGGRRRVRGLGDPFTSPKKSCRWFPTKVVSSRRGSIQGGWLEQVLFRRASKARPWCRTEKNSARFLQYPLRSWRWQPLQTELKRTRTKFNCHMDGGASENVLIGENIFGWLHNKHTACLVWRWCPRQCTQCDLSILLLSWQYSWWAYRVFNPILPFKYPSQLFPTATIHIFWPW